MSPEFQPFRSSSLAMSNPQLYILKVDDENNTGLVRSDTSRDQEIAPNLAPEFQEENKDVLAEDPRCTETSSVSSTESDEKRCLGQSSLSEVAEDDDGFKTPTSSDRKIPVITECPPAPRKIRPSPTKRKLASQPRVRRSLQLDLSREVESMFPPTVQDDLGHKIKKARTEDDKSS